MAKRRETYIISSTPQGSITSSQNAVSISPVDEASAKSQKSNKRPLKYSSDSSVGAWEVSSSSDSDPIGIQLRRLLKDSERKKKKRKVSRSSRNRSKSEKKKKPRRDSGSWLTVETKHTIGDADVSEDEEDKLPDAVPSTDDGDDLLLQEEAINAEKTVSRAESSESAAGTSSSQSNFHENEKKRLISRKRAHESPQTSPERRKIEIPENSHGLPQYYLYRQELLKKLTASPPEYRITPPTWAQFIGEEESDESDKEDESRESSKASEPSEVQENQRRSSSSSAVSISELLARNPPEIEKYTTIRYGPPPRKYYFRKWFSNDHAAIDSFLALKRRYDGGAKEQDSPEREINLPRLRQFFGKNLRKSTENESESASDRRRRLAGENLNRKRRKAKRKW